MKYLILVIVLFYYPLCGQTKDYGEKNGYDWKKFYEDSKLRFSQVEWSNKQEWIDNETYTRKIHYLIGIYDLSTRLPIENYVKYIDEKGKDKYFNSGNPYPYLIGTTPDQMLKALDNFYIDYRNMNIRILDAIHICQMDIKGENPEDIEWQTRYYRADDEGKLKMNNDKYFNKNKK
ncbi:MAG: hypothetical protein PHP42_10835 [Bacteroidota bacterium]|nr:hypothetical protein [Bacteroidota bacterium]